MRAIEEIAASTARYRAAELSLLASTTHESGTSAESAMQRALTTIETYQSVYEKSIASPEERTVHDEFMALWASYLQEHFRAAELAGDDQLEEARAVLANRAGPLFEKAQQKRPTSWRSTPRSKRRVPVKPASASRWSPKRCATWRSARPGRRATPPG